MKERLDPLIAERAPWLFSEAPWAYPARHALTALLGYGRTVALAEYFRHRPSEEILRTLGQMLVQDVGIRGLDKIPNHGAALIVANHPTGIADGIVLNALISRRRDDAFFFANSDILRVLPQLENFIAPVEWRPEKRTHAKTRETMAFTRTALKAGRLGVIFPSGRLAKRSGLQLFEREWMASAAMIARKFDVPVIPVNIQARNSVLFYLLDIIHPTLRDITLFHETLNKGRQPFRITVGDPISACSLPARSEDAIDLLFRTTLALGGRDAASVSLIGASRRPIGALRKPQPAQ